MEVAVTWDLVRPYDPQRDEAAVLQILKANGEVLSAYGEAHYGEFGPEYLAHGTNAVLADGDRVIAFCQFHPDRFGPGVAWVPCFVVTTDLHRSSAYVRAHLAMEAHIKASGASRVVASVPKGHERFRRYLADGRGYRPYHEDGGITYYVKEL